MNYDREKLDRLQTDVEARRAGVSGLNSTGHELRDDARARAGDFFVRHGLPVANGAFVDDETLRIAVGRRGQIRDAAELDRYVATARREIDEVHAIERRAAALKARVDAEMAALAPLAKLVERCSTWAARQEAEATTKRAAK
jgi:hypothetical protein